MNMLIYKNKYFVNKSYMINNLFNYTHWVKSADGKIFINSLFDSSNNVEATINELMKPVMRYT
jgi:hypothetical protein